MEGPETNKRELSEAEKSLINKMGENARIIENNLNISYNILKVSESAKIDLAQGIEGEEGEEFEQERIFSISNINYLINCLQDIIENHWTEYEPESNGVNIKSDCNNFMNFIRDARNRFIHYLSLYINNLETNKFVLKAEEVKYLKTCVLRIKDVLIPELEKLNYTDGVKILERAVMQLEMKIACDDDE